MLKQGENRYDYLYWQSYRAIVQVLEEGNEKQKLVLFNLRAHGKAGRSELNIPQKPGH